MFERFTDRARRVLVVAQIEAGKLNHNYIGTEHILLGLMEEGEGVAATALSALNVTHESLRERIQAGPTPPASEPGTPPPFTPRAKKVLELSLREALQLGHNYIGTEHILLGIIRYGENTATNTLEALGVGVTDVREAVMDLVAGMQYPSLPLSAIVTFEVKPALRRTIAARAQDIKRALGNPLRYELPAPLPAMIEVRTENWGMSLEQCKQYTAWHKQMDDLFHLPGAHPFTLLNNLIQSAVRQASAEYTVRLQAQRAKA